jgi:tetratricopeptide (TPR) repeat protein
MLLAQIHLDLREFDLALKQTDEALKAGRVPAEVMILRATALLGLGKAAEGRGLLEKVVAQIPGNPQAQQRLGLAYLAEKKPQNALEAFSKASDVDPKNLASLAMTVRILASQKKLDEAASRVEGQIKRVGESAGARELLGQVFLAKGDAEKAKKEFERAIEVDPNAVESYLALASLHRGPDARTRALVDADKALAKKPQYVQAWMMKGALLDQGGQFEEANKAYRKALEIKPDLVPALNNLAWNLAEHGGNIDEALKFAQRAVELAPKVAVVNDTLGWIYVKKGVYLNALAQLEPAAESLPKNSAVLYHLGAAYAGKGDSKKAVAALEQAFAASKEFPGSVEAKKLLDKLKKPG